MPPQIDAVILAGGRATRMGGEDKGLIELAGIPMIQHVINRIKPQVTNIIINANRHQDKYQNFGFPVISDNNNDFNGPLAGISQAMAYTKADYLISVACDCPMLPDNLVSKMLTAIEVHDADIAVASDGKYMQPVIMLLKPHLKSSIDAFLSRGDRKIILWYQQHKMITIPFTDDPMAFININTPAQKQQLAATLHQ